MDPAEGRTGEKWGSYLLVSVPVERPRQDKVEMSGLESGQGTVEVNRKLSKSSLCKPLLSGEGRVPRTQNAYGTCPAAWTAPGSRLTARPGRARHWGQQQRTLPIFTSFLCLLSCQWRDEHVVGPAVPWSADILHLQ